VGVKIYTYAIIDSNDKIDESTNGLEGAPLYNIPYGNIGVVASNLHPHTQLLRRKATKYLGVGVNPGYVLKHEEVVERLMENFTVLPVRFLTAFDRKEDVLSMMKDYYSDFRKNLDRLRNKVEFGIKVIWPGDTIRKRIINAFSKSNANEPMSGNSPGKSFMKEKFEKYKIGKQFEKEADRCIAVVDNFFSEIATEKKLERLKSKNLLLTAFYLVKKERQSDFKEAFKRLRSTPSNLKYLFSGPWPPYNFIILIKKPLHQNFSGADIFDG